MTDTENIPCIVHVGRRMGRHNSEYPTGKRKNNGLTDSNSQFNQIRMKDLHRNENGRHSFEKFMQAPTASFRIDKKNTSNEPLHFEFDKWREIESTRKQNVVFEIPTRKLIPAKTDANQLNLASLNTANVQHKISPKANNGQSNLYALQTDNISTRKRSHSTPSTPIEKIVAENDADNSPLTSNVELAWGHKSMNFMSGAFSFKVESPIEDIEIPLDDVEHDRPNKLRNNYVGGSPRNSNVTSDITISMYSSFTNSDAVDDETNCHENGKLFTPSRQNRSQSGQASRLGTAEPEIIEQIEEGEIAPIYPEEEEKYDDLTRAEMMLKMLNRASDNFKNVMNPTAKWKYLAQMNKLR